MMSTKGKRSLRSMLYEANPCCPECDVEMILPNTLPKDKHGRIKHFPDNTCVLKRNFSRYNGYERSQNKKPAVLMCRKCSEEKAQKEQEGISVIERRVRSERH